MLSDYDSYRNSFGRFVGDKLNGWIEEKRLYHGKEGKVTKTYGDFTVTIVFDDGVQLDFSMESVEEQLTVEGFSVGGAQIKAFGSPELFKECFSRFVGDELNYWNESKHAKMGEIGFITTVYGDKTVTMLFNDDS